MSEKRHTEGDRRHSFLEFVAKPGQKFIKKLQKNAKFDEKHEKLGNSITEVFNGEKMNEMRKNMLANKKCKQCAKCYDQEESGFFSLRLSSSMT